MSSRRDVTRYTGWFLVAALLVALTGEAQRAEAADSLTASDRQAVIRFASQFETALASAYTDPKSSSKLLAPVADASTVKFFAKFFSKLAAKGERANQRFLKLVSTTVQSGNSKTGRAVVSWCGAEVSDYFVKDELSSSGTYVYLTTAEVRRSGGRWLMATFKKDAGSDCAKSLDEPELRPDILSIVERYRAVDLDLQRTPEVAPLLLPAVLGSPALERELKFRRESAVKGLRWVGTDDDYKIVSSQVDDAVVFSDAVVRVRYCAAIGGYVTDKDGKKLPETDAVGVDEFTVSVTKMGRLWKAIYIGRINEKVGKSTCNAPAGKKKKKK
jgi:hypothetical protein